MPVAYMIKSERLIILIEAKKLDMNVQSSKMNWSST